MSGGVRRPLMSAGIQTFMTVPPLQLLCFQIPLEQVNAFTKHQSHQETKTQCFCESPEELAWRYYFLWPYWQDATNSSHFLTLNLLCRTRVNLKVKLIKSCVIFIVSRYVSAHYQETLDPSVEQACTGNTLGVELYKVHRRFSGNLQLPPLSWRQGEKDRSKPLSPDEDPEVATSRPTSLPIASLPRIDITEADPDRYSIGQQPGLCVDWRDNGESAGLACIFFFADCVSPGQPAALFHIISMKAKGLFNLWLFCLTLYIIWSFTSSFPPMAALIVDFSPFSMIATTLHQQLLLSYTYPVFFQPLFVEYCSLCLSLLHWLL